MSLIVPCARPESPDFDDIYIVTDLMETDLHRVIYSKQAPAVWLYADLAKKRSAESTRTRHRELLE